MITMMMMMMIIIMIIILLAVFMLLSYEQVILRVKAGFHYPSWQSELTGDRFPLPVNTDRVDGRAFPLHELTACVDG